MRQRLLDLIVSENAFTQTQIDEFFSRSGRFSNVVVINMPNRTDRLLSAAYTLNKVGLSFERFIAINGRELNEKDTSWSEKFPRLRLGELGCLLSHFSIAALAASHPDQDAFTLIFEDDVVTSSGDIHGLFNEIIAIDKNERLDLVYFGKCLETCGKMVHIQNNIYRPFKPYCTHSYAIRNSFARRVLEDMSNCGESGPHNCEYYNHAIDGLYGNMIIDNLAKAIVIHPSVFYQDVLTGGSDLRTEYMVNYQECNDTYSKCKEIEPLPTTQISGGLDPYWLVILIAIVVVFGYFYLNRKNY